MKKILMALLMVSCVTLSAEAQKKCACKHTTKQVVKHTNAAPKDATKTGNSKYAENFKVCQVSCGYSICGQAPTVNNTAPKVCGKMLSENPNEATTTANQVYIFQSRSYNDRPIQNGTNNPAMLAPQSQSYPANADGTNPNITSAGGTVRR